MSVCPNTLPVIVRWKPAGGYWSWEAVDPASRLAFPLQTAGSTFQNYSSSVPPDQMTICRINAAAWSAFTMMDERNERLRLSGGVPLYPVYPNGTRNNDAYLRLQAQFKQDSALSLRQILDDDHADATGDDSILMVSLDGVPTFTPERIAQREFEVLAQEQKRLDTAVVGEILKSGGNLAIANEISQTLVNNPIAAALLQSQVDNLIEDADPIHSGVQARVDLPAGEDNQLSQAEEIQRLADIARNQVDASLENYRVAQNEANADWKAATNYAAWRESYPDVKLLPKDNPSVDPFILRTPWVGPNPPLVSLSVTPRQKPKPEASFFNSTVGKILGTALAFIPVVGTVLAAGVAIASAASAKNFAKAWQRPTSEFEPQYEPVTFLVVLPLNQAQLAVQKPWYLPALFQQFNQSLGTGNLDLIGSVIESGNPLPPDSRDGRIPQDAQVSASQLISSLFAAGAVNPASPYADQASLTPAGLASSTEAVKSSYALPALIGGAVLLLFLLKRKD